MKVSSKRVLVDETNHPVAVQIDYAEWLEIEAMLAGPESGSHTGDLLPFIGGLKDWPEDPVDYQRRLRDEWD